MAALFVALALALGASAALAWATVSARRAVERTAETLTALRLAHRGALAVVRVDAERAREQARRARG